MSRALFLLLFLINLLLIYESTVVIGYFKYCSCFSWICFISFHCSLILVLIVLVLLCLNQVFTTNKLRFSKTNSLKVTISVFEVVISPSGLIWLGLLRIYYLTTLLLFSSWWTIRETWKWRSFFIFYSFVEIFYTKRFFIVSRLVFLKLHFPNVNIWRKVKILKSETIFKTSSSIIRIIFWFSFIHFGMKKIWGLLRS